MAKMQAELANGPFALGGIVEIDPTMLRTLAAQDVNARGIVLANERKNIYIQHEDGRLIPYTLSVYVQRGPLDDDELANVEKTAKERESSKRQRETDEQNKREREIKRATELGSDAVISAINRLGSGLGQAAAILNHATQR